MIPEYIYLDSIRQQTHQDLVHVLLIDLDFNENIFLINTALTI